MARYILYSATRLFFYIVHALKLLEILIHLHIKELKNYTLIKIINIETDKPAKPNSLHLD